jgi:hypothetical protein
MKKLLLLLLLLPYLAISQAIPADASQFENIQLTNNVTDNVAVKVTVQNSNGVLNTISKSSLIEVLEYASASALPVTGTAGKIYVTIDNQRQYRWTGSIYNEFYNFKAETNNPTFTGSVIVPAATLAGQAVNKGQIDLFNQSSSTGLAQGAKMTINTDTAKFDVAAGFGYIVNGASNVLVPTSTKVTWTAKIANTLPAIATQENTYVAIDVSGNLFLTANPLTATQRRNYIKLGVVTHVNNTSINNIDNQPNVNIEVGAQLQDVLEFLGFQSVSGNRIFPVSTNLQIKKEAGVVFKKGSNFDVLTTQPHTFTLPEQSPITFKYRTQTGSEGAAITSIDPDIYDLNGTITPVGSTATLATIQRIYVAQNGNVRIQPGQRVFTTLNGAVTAINSDVFVTDTDLSDNSLYLGAIVLTRNTVNLADIAQAIFVPSKGTSANGSVATTPIGYTPEDVANKQNNLTLDGTGAKYGTIDAINAGFFGTTYTPTTASSNNVTNIVYTQSAVTKVGNSVSVRISLSFSVTSGSTSTNIGFNFPIVKITNASTAFLGSGVLNSAGSSINPLIFGLNNKTTANLNFNSAAAGGTGNFNGVIMFTYLIDDTL